MADMRLACLVCFLLIHFATRTDTMICFSAVPLCRGKRARSHCALALFATPGIPRLVAVHPEPTGQSSVSRSPARTRVFAISIKLFREQFTQYVLLSTSLDYEPCWVFLVPMLVVISVKTVTFARWILSQPRLRLCNAF
jgi:hypothetical protein